MITHAQSRACKLQPQRWPMGTIQSCFFTMFQKSGKGLKQLLIHFKNSFSSGYSRGGNVELSWLVIIITMYRCSKKSTMWVNFVMCALTLQLSEYSAYNFSSNAYKVVSSGFLLSFLVLQTRSSYWTPLYSPYNSIFPASSKLHRSTKIKS